MSVKKKVYKPQFQLKTRKDSFCQVTMHTLNLFLSDMASTMQIVMTFAEQLNNYKQHILDPLKIEHLDETYQM